MQIDVSRESGGLEQRQRRLRSEAGSGRWKQGRNGPSRRAIEIAAPVENEPTPTELT